MENEKLKIGKTYRHKKVGTVIEILKEASVLYESGTQLFYQVKVLMSKRVDDVYKILQLSVSEIGNWEEVAVDCDGLVYKLEG
ncbi:hypothetical protein A3K72_01650 [Candidatus Woesearchaeota archaeon RBG_13_36_6]|nr:MAG: hypothetical protein A3K72_01650 [Candidatus Woesearchaeota archaeon RBG_13_36_6]